MKKKDENTCSFLRRLGAILYDCILLGSVLFFGTFLLMPLYGSAIESDSIFYPIYLMIIAYEPVWSIGTNKIPNAKDLENVIKYIKKDFKKNFKTKKYPNVLYGGSVNKNNVKFLSSVSELDGFLIGGASQSSKKFIDIIKNYYK